MDFFMTKNVTLTILKPKVFIMKYNFFQYKGITFSFSEIFRFIMLKWDHCQFHITVMQSISFHDEKCSLFKWIRAIISVNTIPNGTTYQELLFLPEPIRPCRSITFLMFFFFSKRSRNKSLQFSQNADSGLIFDVLNF